LYGYDGDYYNRLLVAYNNVLHMKCHKYTKSVLLEHFKDNNEIANKICGSLHLCSFKKTAYILGYRNRKKAPELTVFDV